MHQYLTTVKRFALVAVVALGLSATTAQVGGIPRAEAAATCGDGGSLLASAEVKDASTGYVVGVINLCGSNGQTNTRYANFVQTKLQTYATTVDATVHGKDGQQIDKFCKLGQSTYTICNTVPISGVGLTALASAEASVFNGYCTGIAPSSGYK